MNLPSSDLPGGEADVVVVGAGVAGLAAAVTLGRYGIRTTVIEQASPLGRPVGEGRSASAAGDVAHDGPAPRRRPGRRRRRIRRRSDVALVAPSPG